MVPTLKVTEDGVWLTAQDDALIELDDIASITEAMADFAKRHKVNGEWILVPDSDVEYTVIVQAIDAARAASFEFVTIAGGAMQ